MLTSVLDGRLFGERVGGIPSSVLALHGWGRTRADLRPVLAGMDALAVDLPGFGASPTPIAGWGSVEYAHLMAPLLAALAPNPVLVGHSFGGRVAVQIAAADPSSVGHLILTGVPLIRARQPRISPTYRVMRAAARKGIVPDRIIESQRRKRGSEDYRAASGVMRDVLVRVVNEGYENVLAGVTCPVTMVYGELDTAAPIEQAREALSLLPTARLEVVQGAGHLLDGSLIAALRQAIIDALDRRGIEPRR